MEIPRTIWKFQGPYGNSKDHMEIPMTIWKFHPVTIWKFQGPYGNSKDHMERLFRDCLLDCCAAVPSTGSKQKFWYQPSVSWYSQHYLGLLMHPGFLQSWFIQTEMELSSILQSALRLWDLSIQVEVKVCTCTNLATTMWRVRHLVWQRVFYVFLPNRRQKWSCLAGVSSCSWTLGRESL